MKITVIPGDGIGPEITESTLKILEAAGAELNPVFINVGQSEFSKGVSSGITTQAWEQIRESSVILKGPVATPQGAGVKSINVTLRKTLGLYANVRHVTAYAPFIKSLFSKGDLVIIRENEEDVYAGIEHRQTEDVLQCLKLISIPGCARICRYAFEFTRANKRKKVTCMTKDNIMKLTDGMFHKVFDDIGAEYPELEKDHMIIDIGMAKAAVNPEKFDVIVLPNLYGDILSDVVAEVYGSVGICGSANIGDRYAVFEAIHGTAPDIAGKDLANPSGLLLSALQMLLYLEKSEISRKIYNAWLKTLESGIHTGDIYKEGTSQKKVSCSEFTQAIIERLGEKPSILQGSLPKEIKFAVSRSLPQKSPLAPPPIRELIGVDIFLCSHEEPEAIAKRLEALTGEKLMLEMISNRGVRVWPERFPETTLTDHSRCRFVKNETSQKTPLAYTYIIELMDKIAKAGLEIIKSENLYLFDGKPGFSLGQGQ
jgi:isocitrate dehydrogenase